MPVVLLRGARGGKKISKKLTDVYCVHSAYWCLSKQWEHVHTYTHCVSVSVVSSGRSDAPQAVMPLRAVTVHADSVLKAG